MRLREITVRRNGSGDPLTLSDGALNAVAIDSVELAGTVVPELTTWALLAGGLTVLGFARTRLRT